MDEETRRTLTDAISHCTLVDSGTVTRDVEGQFSYDGLARALGRETMRVGLAETKGGPGDLFVYINHSNLGDALEGKSCTWELYCDDRTPPTAARNYDNGR